MRSMVEGWKARLQAVLDRSSDSTAVTPPPPFGWSPSPPLRGREAKPLGLPSGPVRGKAIKLDRVSVDGKEVRNIDAAIAEGLDQPLPGQAYLSRISSVEMSKDRMRLQ